MIKAVSFAAVLLLFTGCSGITNSNPSLQEDKSIEVSKMTIDASTTDGDSTLADNPWDGTWGSEGYVW